MKLVESPHNLWNINFWNWAYLSHFPLTRKDGMFNVIIDDFCQRCCISSATTFTKFMGMVWVLVEQSL